VVAGALADGCKEIVLGIGGSASTDGGAGLVRALGATLLGTEGREVPEGGAALAAVSSLDLRTLRARTAGVRFVVACDVDNPLIGPMGAASVYGPQKGAVPAEVAELDAALAHWADVVAAHTGRDRRGVPGAGAAGGVGFAAVALLDAVLRRGIELVLDLVGFRAQLANADLVVTGEGALDEQTLHGKVPVGVAAAAHAAGVPVVAVCGQNSLQETMLAAAGISAVYSLTELEPDVLRCIAHGSALLGDLGERIATEHLQRTVPTESPCTAGCSAVTRRRRAPPGHGRGPP
jgi:glycerate kinase